MVDIPLRADLTHYDMQVVLDGVTYTLEFRWNDRERAWYMDLGAEDGTPIVNSVKVVVGFPLAGRLANVAGAPPGRLIAFDTTNRDLNPGVADLGDRVTLVYMTNAEIAETLDG